MRFDPLVRYTEMVRDDLSIVYKGDDGRFYVANADTPDQWDMSTTDFASAMGSLHHTREFWAEKRDPDIRDSLRTVRVNGTHFRIGPEDKDARGMRGFGGAKFIIMFHDGRRVVSTNLWCQGTIPKPLRGELPDNAEFGKDN
jgi:hypothetical protein